MTKRQIEKAARLYGLAVVACSDAGGAETVEESDVVHLAIERARNRLTLLGHHWPALSSLQSCIDAAKGMNRPGFSRHS